MLNSGKQFCALRDKKIDILTLVLSEKKILNETKKHNPPCKLNGRSLILNCVEFTGAYHCSDSPLFRSQIIIPTAHYSDSPLLRQPISPTTHYSVKNC